MQPDEFTESEFRSVLVALLYALSSASQRGSVNLAVMDIEEYLNEIQDDMEVVKLWEVFQILATDEALRNYYATR